MKQLSTLLLILAIILFSAISGFASPADESDRPLVLTISIEGMITSGNASRIEKAIQEAESQNAAALVIILDTPGGIVDSTLGILSDLSASNVPVVTFVSPNGAIAASAGAFMLLGGHIAAMSPGTTTGAAMPVTVSPA